MERLTYLTEFESHEWSIFWLRNGDSLLNELIINLLVWFGSYNSLFKFFIELSHFALESQIFHCSKIFINECLIHFSSLININEDINDSENEHDSKNDEPNNWTGYSVFRPFVHINTLIKEWVLLWGPLCLELCIHKEHCSCK